MGKLGRRRAHLAEVARLSEASLEQAIADRDDQLGKLHAERRTIGRRYDQIISDNDLAERVRRAFAGE